VSESKPSRLPGAQALSLCLLFFGLAAVSCRTTRPAGKEIPLAPVSATGSRGVIAELARRMETIHAIRSLMRVRIVTAERTQSFRAQLLVEPRSGRMHLTAYTPLGTEAMTLAGEGDHVVFVDDINRTAWQGSMADLAKSVGFFDAQTPPAAWALDIAGFPARGSFEASDRGLASATAGEVAISFDPPAFPPRQVTVRRGSESLEITHLELVETDADVPAPSIPSGYRCCIAPRM
jgi:hypothetical protein